ncbi:MAG: hypothetical protein Q8P81_02210 [Nanoarchaeota archaeon]|nr:hypothetical protein [Nanoarchaeota archaeon]
MEFKETIKDFFSNRLFSRKLLVWITSTVLLCFKIIDQNTWLILAATYMGMNTTLTAIDAIRSTKDKMSRESTTTTVGSSSATTGPSSTTVIQSVSGQIISEEKDEGVV